jgi:cholesterol oxidase
VRLLASDRDWTIDESMPGGKVAFDVHYVESSRLAVQFTEKMSGFCSTAALASDYAAAENDGRQKGSLLEFVLTISAEDLRQMLLDPMHEADAFGSVRAPALSTEALTVYGGKFNLFVADPQTPGLQRMRYRLPLVSVEGRSFFFDGFKLIHRAPPFDLWRDTTTLFVTVYEGSDAGGAVAAKGILRIAELDFARQVTTITAHDSRDELSPRGIADFGEFFLKDLWKQYRPQL